MERAHAWGVRVRIRLSGIYHVFKLHFDASTFFVHIQFFACLVEERGRRDGLRRVSRHAASIIIFS